MNCFPRIFRVVVIATGVFLVSIFATAGTALGQTTFWIADEGDWVAGSNWSDGRPAPGIDAQINNGGTARIVNPAVASDVILGFSLPNSGTLEVMGQAEFGGNLTVGYDGTGTLSIQNGGSVSTSNVGTNYIAFGNSSTGTVTVTGEGSTLDTTAFVVGQNGMGTLTIEDGGDVNSSTGEIGELGTGTVNVTDTGSSWDTSSLTVGNCDEGTLMISNSARVGSDRSFIGRRSDSTGTVTVTGEGSVVTGEGSVWNTGRLSIGGDAFSGENGGTGTLTIGPGGTVSTSEEIVLFPDGLVQLQGGLLSTREFDFQGGQFEWTSGILWLDLWDGDLTIPSGGTFIPGRLGGSDTISGTVLGNYTQESDATLLIGIAGLTPGTEFSVLAVDGTATLDGTLDVLLDESVFTPEIGDEFTVLTAESVVDNGLELGSLVDGGAPAASLFELVVDSTSVTLRAISTTPSLPGDFNGDGIVDAADYTVWRDGLGGTFNQDDYDVWKNNFGMTAGATGTSPTLPVTEPGAGILISVAFGGVIAMRRRLRAGSAGAPSSRVAAPVAYAPGLPRTHCGGMPISSTWRWPM